MFFQLDSSNLYSQQQIVDLAVKLHVVASLSGRNHKPKILMRSRVGPDTTFERHFRISDLAKQWSLGRETVRKLVKDDPGVLKLRISGKKTSTTYSVPESAARRIVASTLFECWDNAQNATC
jgi:hypothetical protein